MKKQFQLVSILVSCLISISAVSADNAASGEAKKDSCATGQQLHPIKQVGMYLDGYHAYKHEDSLEAEKQKQIRTAHYCKQVHPDLFQCLIYDGNGPDAKCIGVEYVITDKKFKELPEKEQKLWHPHDAEVDTGLLVMPGLSPEKEKEILGVLRSTHGKTWQTWPDLSTDVPMGDPTLMWSIDPSKINETTKKSAAGRKVDHAF